MTHQPVSMVSQCSLIAWLNGLTSGDQHQLTGSGSALEACSRRCAVQMAAYTSLSKVYLVIMLPMFRDSPWCIVTASSAFAELSNLRYKNVINNNNNNNIWYVVSIQCSTCCTSAPLRLLFHSAIQDLVVVFILVKMHL